MSAQPARPAAPAASSAAAAADLVGASRLPQVGTTAFTLISQLATQHGAVNLGQGFPDFDCDARLQQLLTEAMTAGHNQYAPMPGVAALRTAIAAKMQVRHGHVYDPEREVTITAGATQALMASILALVHPGDEVIVFEPVYDSYVPAIELAGGTPVFITLHAADGYAPDWRQVRAALSPRTRMIVLNFPHNPTGRVLRDDDLVQLQALVDGTRVLLLSDEVYEHIVYDGVPHRSLAGVPALAERALVVGSFGKTLHVTGWKVGSVCAPAALTIELRKVHQFMVFAVNTPAQHAIAAYLADGAAVDALAAFFQRKRDLFINGLAATRLRPLPCEGSYFVTVDYSAVADEPQMAFVRRLIEQVGVAAIPLDIFYRTPQPERLVRLCFAKREATLHAGLQRLQRL